MISKNCKYPIKKSRIYITENINKRKVVNISKSYLGKHEISILSKGLNFIPTSKEMKKLQFYKEVDHFKRNLSLKVFFNKENDGKNSQTNEPYKSTILEKIVRQQNKKPFEPPHENCILAFSEALKDEIENSRPSYFKSNTTEDELRAINNLANRSDIVIKKADKGGATVVLDAKWYENEAERQLNNTVYYKKVEDDDTKKHEQIIKSKLNEFVVMNQMDLKLAQQLTPCQSRTPEFYLLPKIHKDPVTGRPVISSTGCHTERISAYVDEFLQPAAQKLPSHIKDSGDFIGKVKKIGKISPNDILVTMDVSSLYTNIDNNEGIKAIEQNSTITSSLSKQMIQIITTLMSLILTLNNFVFNGMNYHQVKGTAMGTRAAPNYANIFMGWFEEKYIYKSCWMKHIRYYGRFIDDIIIFWKGDENELSSFLTYINTVHPTIKFTSEHSSKIDFLDITISKDIKGYLTTDVYQKPTDTHNYLQHNSSHPSHCIKSIPFSQFVRLKRIITDPVALRKRLKEYIEYFVNSGYPRKTLEKTAQEILKPSVEKQQKARVGDLPDLRFVTTYNQSLPNIKKITDKHWGIIQTNGKCRNALKSNPQIVYKKGKNLSNYLVRAKYRSGKGIASPKNGKGVTKCNKAICSWCKNVVECTEFTSRTTQKQYKILHTMNCTSKWVIYLCECKVHHKQYIGKSETQLNIRMNNNRNHLKLVKPKCKLVQHSKESNDCNFERDLTIIPIEQLDISRDNTRSLDEKKEALKRREIFWQKTLSTFTPHGLNKREG